MKKIILSFAFLMMLMTFSAENLFGYRNIKYRIVNGEVVEIECFGSGGTCLPEVIVR